MKFYLAYLKADDVFEDYRQEEDWFKTGKKEFKGNDWANEVEAFRLNNDSAKESLIEFANGLF